MQEGVIPKGRVGTLISFGFLIGIGLFSFGQWLNEVWCLGLAITFIFVSLFFKKYWLRVGLIILIGIGLAGWRYGLSYPTIDSDHISYYNGELYTFEGVISKEPIQRLKGWQLTIQTDHGRVLVNTAPWPIYYYGDYLEIRCRLEAPESKEFSYDRYLARYGMYSVCYRPEIKVIDREQGNIIYNFILRVKARAYELARTSIPEPEASLALPVVFGGGQDIDLDISDDFRRTGLTHIMAVSGFNVSLLTALIGLGLYGLGLRRRLVFYITSLLIAAYVMMVGAPASAVRAGVMSLVLLLAITVGRISKLPRTVLLVAVMTLVVNPRLLRDDIGWQLSFLAILGLMYVHPWLQTLGSRVTRGKGKWIIEALAATMAAQIATAPVIMYNFGQFSLIAPLSNLLVVWVVPMLTMAMIISLILTALIPSLGLIFFFPGWLMVKYIFWVVQILSQVGWAVVELK